MSNVPWTDEQKLRLIDLWGEGHSVRVIGEMMSLTKNQIVGAVHRLIQAGRLTARPNPIKNHVPARPRPEKRIPLPQAATDWLMKADTVTAPPPPPPPPKPPVTAPAAPRMPRRLAAGPAIASYRTCQYPEGDVRPYRFCGAPTIQRGEGRSPYCMEHSQLCFERWKRPMRDAA